MSDPLPVEFDSKVREHPASKSIYSHLLAVAWTSSQSWITLWKKIQCLRFCCLCFILEFRTLLVAIFYQMYLPKQRKQRKNKQDNIKLKNFCTPREIINKIKRQPTELENIFTDISDKGIISKTDKELTKFNTKKTTKLKNG